MTDSGDQGLDGAPSGETPSVPPAISEALDAYRTAIRMRSMWEWDPLSRSGDERDVETFREWNRADQAVESAILSALPREEPQPADVAFLREQAEQHLAMAERRAGMVRADVNPERDATLAARNREIAARYNRIADTLSLYGPRVVPPEPAPSGEALEALERLTGPTARHDYHDPPCRCTDCRRDALVVLRALSPEAAAVAERDEEYALASFRRRMAQFGSPPSPPPTKG